MNTYDPADGIRYVHLAPDLVAAPSAATGRGHRCTRLPVGYANQSPHTCLRSPRKALVDNAGRYPRASSS